MKLGARLIRAGAGRAMMRVAEPGGGLISWHNAGTLVVLLLMAGWFFTARPAFLGGPASYITISGVSMEPTLSSGDLVIVREQDSYEAGDIIAFRIPAGEAGAGLNVVHRIVGGSGDVGYDTQGDNRGSLDPWHPKNEDVIGKRWVDVPFSGRVLTTLRDPLLVGILAGVLAGAAAFRASGTERDSESQR